MGDDGPDDDVAIVYGGRPGGCMLVCGKRKRELWEEGCCVGNLWEMWRGGLQPVKEVPVNLVLDCVSW